MRVLGVGRAVGRARHAQVTDLVQQQSRSRCTPLYSANPTRVAGAQGFLGSSARHFCRTRSCSVLFKFKMLSTRRRRALGAPSSTSGWRLAHMPIMPPMPPASVQRVVFNSAKPSPLFIPGQLASLWGLGHLGRLERECGLGIVVSYTKEFREPLYSMIPGIKTALPYQLARSVVPPLNLLSIPKPVVHTQG